MPKAWTAVNGSDRESTELSICFGEERTIFFNYNKKIVPNAQNLRTNMTPEEKRLWYDFLKKLPITVHRQKNIGNYIVDFYISSAQLGIEIDGRQDKMPEHQKEDAQRDGELYRLGIRVLRYTNEDIYSRFPVVCQDILKQLNLNASDLKS